MVDSGIFLGAVIIAVTQAIKLAFPEKVHGVVTVGVAVALGVLLALVDTEIGVADISVAQGVLLALASVGVHTTASRVGETAK